VTDDVEKLLVETEALKMLTFYSENYDTLLFRDIDSGAKKEMLGTKNAICRFCLRGKPEVKFSKDAHAVPAFIGNKVLFTRYECNDCNDRFSEFEDDLAKMTMGDRALAQVPKRKGFASLKPQGKKSSFERGQQGVIIKQYLDEGVFTLDTANSQLVTTYDTQPFRPLGAYKALAKIAYTLLPDEELANFEELRIWLNEKDVSTHKVYADKGHWCFHTFVPGPSPFPKPIVSMMRRKHSIEAPYLMFFLAFGNWTYQIFVPCPKMDSALAGQTLQIIQYPHHYMLQPWLAKGRVQQTQMFMDAKERKSESRSLRIHYDGIVEGSP
jgi:hypothetical protein